MSQSAQCKLLSNMSQRRPPCLRDLLTPVPIDCSLSEFFSRRDRDTIVDHKARLDAIESLKKMIESWLEETFSDTFSEDEIHNRAESMDMSLIEQKKEENMKTIYEINSVIRMSLIEMQFIKKVRVGRCECSR